MIEEDFNLGLTVHYLPIPEPLDYFTLDLSNGHVVVVINQSLKRICIKKILAEELNRFYSAF